MQTFSEVELGLDLTRFGAHMHASLVCFSPAEDHSYRRARSEVLLAFTVKLQSCFLLEGTAVTPKFRHVDCDLGHIDRTSVTSSRARPSKRNGCRSRCNQKFITGPRMLRNKLPALF